jgi:gamma-glutamyltranspeptidase
VAVPLELKGLWMAHQAYGQAPWGALVSPAASLARNGFRAHPYLVNALNQSAMMGR